MSSPTIIARDFIEQNPRAAELVHDIIAAKRAVGLTKMQKKVLDFLQAYSRDNDGVMPTLQEIMEHLDHASKAGVHRILTALEERGYIERLYGRARAIRLK